MYRSNNLACNCALALIALAFSNVAGCGGGTPPAGPGQPFAALSLEPSSISMSRGNQSSSTITTQVGGSFTGSLTFSAAGAPEGVTVSFDPPSVAGSGSSIVTVSVAQRTSTGSYPITISGNGDSLNTTTTLTVIATAEVLLTWDPSTSGDVVGYSISRSETSGGGYVRLNSDLTSGTSYTDDTVQSGHTYYYVATAVNSIGVESIASNEAFAEVP